MNQRGNALFLILIAVALFAALSYAVTQSGGGGGTIDKEQAIITSANITQYGASVSNTVMRMMLTGTAVTSLNFVSTATGENAVFAADGGGAKYDDPSANAQTVVSGFYGWQSSGDNTMPGIGTSGCSGADTSCSDIIILLSDLSDAVCRAINSKLVGVSTYPTVAPSIEFWGAGTPFQGTFGFNPPSVSSGSPDITGEHYMCVDNSGTGYTYYHVLVAR